MKKSRVARKAIGTTLQNPEGSDHRTKIRVAAIGAIAVVAAAVIGAVRSRSGDQISANGEARGPATEGGGGRRIVVPTSEKPGAIIISTDSGGVSVLGNNNHVGSDDSRTREALESLSKTTKALAVSDLLQAEREKIEIWKRNTDEIAAQWLHATKFVRGRLETIDRLLSEKGMTPERAIVMKQVLNQIHQELNTEFDKFCELLTRAGVTVEATRERQTLDQAKEGVLRELAQEELTANVARTVVNRLGQVVTTQEMYLKHLVKLEYYRRRTALALKTKEEVDSLNPPGQNEAG
ncbi:MAG TPA: hypothetical protein P5081_13220 [Phycisphaerae bacterium]|nr:hypothetical protein [Phycisphaerae bacterium]HRW53836.1 hypothetical protein [Phycisphaerae bacterium]